MTPACSTTALGDHRSGTGRRGARPSSRCTTGRSGVSTTASQARRSVGPPSAARCRTAVTRPPDRSSPVTVRPYTISAPASAAAPASARPTWRIPPRGKYTPAIVSM